MASENRKSVAGLRKYYQEEIETMIRQMKIEGGTLEDSIAEMNTLADFVRSQTDTLREAWPTLLKETACEQWEQRLNEAGITGVPMGKSDDQSLQINRERCPQNEHGRSHGKPQRFLKEVAFLTVHHEVIADNAVVFPSAALGAALSRVDSD